MRTCRGSITGATRFTCGAVSLLIATVVSAAPVTYTGFVVTNVSLGTQYFKNAKVTFTFRGDTGDVKTFSVTAPDGVNGAGSWITKGHATVTIVKGGETVNATLAPGQLFVSADTVNGGIGFGSTVASGLEPAYPLAFTVGSSGDYASSWNSTDKGVLQSTVSVSGAAFSCIGYPGSTPNCTDPTISPLKTDLGPLIVFQPYVADIEGAHHGSVNRGTFQVFVGSFE